MNIRLIVKWLLSLLIISCWFFQTSFASHYQYGRTTWEAFPINGGATYSVNIEIKTQWKTGGPVSSPLNSPPKTNIATSNQGKIGTYPWYVQKGSINTTSSFNSNIFYSSAARDSLPRNYNNTPAFSGKSTINLNGANGKRISSPFVDMPAILTVPVGSSNLYQEFPIIWRNKELEHDTTLGINIGNSNDFGLDNSYHHLVTKNNLKVSINETTSRLIFEWDVSDIPNDLTANPSQRSYPLYQLTFFIEEKWKNGDLLATVPLDFRIQLCPEDSTPKFDTIYTSIEPIEVAVGQTATIRALASMQSQAPNILTPDGMTLINSTPPRIIDSSIETYKEFSFTSQTEGDYSFTLEAKDPNSDCKISTIVIIRVGPRMEPPIVVPYPTAVSPVSFETVYLSGDGNLNLNFYGLDTDFQEVNQNLSPKLSANTTFSFSLTQDPSVEFSKQGYSNGLVSASNLSFTHEIVSLYAEDQMGLIGSANVDIVNLPYPIQLDYTPCVNGGNATVSVNAFWANPSTSTDNTLTYSVNVVDFQFSTDEGATYQSSYKRADGSFRYVSLPSTLILSNPPFANPPFNWQIEQDFPYGYSGNLKIKILTNGSNILDIVSENFIINVEAPIVARIEVNDLSAINVQEDSITLNWISAGAGNFESYLINHQQTPFTSTSDTFSINNLTDETLGFRANTSYNVKNLNNGLHYFELSASMLDPTCPPNVIYSDPVFLFLVEMSYSYCRTQSTLAQLTFSGVGKFTEQTNVNLKNFSYSIDRGRSFVHSNHIIGANNLLFSPTNESLSIQWDLEKDIGRRDWANVILKAEFESNGQTSLPITTTVNIDNNPPVVTLIDAGLNTSSANSMYLKWNLLDQSPNTFYINNQKNKIEQESTTWEFNPQNTTSLANTQTRELQFDNLGSGLHYFELKVDDPLNCQSTIVYSTPFMVFLNEMDLTYCHETHPHGLINLYGDFEEDLSMGIESFSYSIDGGNTFLDEIHHLSGFSESGVKAEYSHGSTGTNPLKLFFGPNIKQNTLHWDILKDLEHGVHDLTMQFIFNFNGYLSPPIQSSNVIIDTKFPIINNFSSNVSDQFTSGNLMSLEWDPAIEDHFVDYGLNIATTPFSGNSTEFFFNPNTWGGAKTQATNSYDLTGYPSGIYYFELSAFDQWCQRTVVQLNSGTFLLSGNLSFDYCSTKSPFVNLNFTSNWVNPLYSQISHAEYSVQGGEFKSMTSISPAIGTQFFNGIGNNQQTYSWNISSDLSPADRLDLKVRIKLSCQGISSPWIISDNLIIDTLAPTQPDLSFRYEKANGKNGGIISSWTINNESIFNGYYLNYGANSHNTSVGGTFAYNPTNTPALATLAGNSFLMENLNSGISYFEIMVGNEECNFSKQESAFLNVPAQAISLQYCHDKLPYMVLQVYSDNMNSANIQLHDFKYRKFDGKFYNGTHLPKRIDSISQSDNILEYHWDFLREDPRPLGEYRVKVQFTLSLNGIVTPWYESDFYWVDTLPPNSPTSFTKTQTQKAESLNLIWESEKQNQTGATILNPTGNFKQYIVTWKNLTLGSNMVINNSSSNLSLGNIITNSFVADNITPGDSYEYSLTVEDQFCNTSKSSFTYGLVKIEDTTIEIPFQKNHSHPLIIRGGIPPYNYSIVSGNLPVDTSFNNGVFTSFSDNVKSIDLTIKVNDKNDITRDIKKITLNYLPATPLQMDDLLPDDTVLNSYYGKITPMGGLGDYEFFISSGNLPAGLSLSKSGEIIGSTTEVGEYNFTIEMRDLHPRNQASLIKNFNIKINPTPLNIVTTNIPGLYFDEGYNFQLIGEGGSGEYNWSISNGVLPPGFYLNPNTGVISGRYNLLEIQSIQDYTFNIQITDLIYPPNGNLGSGNFSLEPATKTFTLSPDSESYCWDIYKTGQFHVSRNHHLGDYCFIFFEGKGIDIYFGTENYLLNLPSTITIDGTPVTPIPVDSELTTDPKFWNSDGHAQWRRYRLHDSLAPGKHVLKITAPIKNYTSRSRIEQNNVQSFTENTSDNLISSSNLSSTANLNSGADPFQVATQETAQNISPAIGGTLLFESIQILIPERRGNGYYFRKDVLPSESLYRCGHSQNRTKIFIDPKITIKGQTLTFEHFPQSEASTTTQSKKAFQEDIHHDLLPKTDHQSRQKTLTTVPEEYTPLVKIYNQLGEHTKSIFPDHLGRIQMPNDEYKFEISFLSKSDGAQNSYEVPLTTSKELIAKYSTQETTSITANLPSTSSPVENASQVPSIPVTSSTAPSGGGGGGCSLH